MRAITVRDRLAGISGLTLTELPYPHAAANDVVVRVHAAGGLPALCLVAPEPVSADHTETGVLRPLP